MVYKMPKFLIDPKSFCSCLVGKLSSKQHGEVTVDFMTIFGLE